VEKIGLINLGVLAHFGSSGLERHSMVAAGGFRWLMLVVCFAGCPKTAAGLKFPSWVLLTM